MVRGYFEYLPKAVFKCEPSDTNHFNKLESVVLCIIVVFFVGLGKKISFAVVVNG